MTPILTRHLAALGPFTLDVAVRALRLQLLLPRTRRLTLWSAITVNAYGEAAAAVTPRRPRARRCPFPRHRTRSAARAAGRGPR